MPGLVGVRAGLVPCLDGCRGFVTMRVPPALDRATDALITRSASAQFKNIRNLPELAEPPTSPEPLRRRRDGSGRLNAQPFRSSGRGNQLSRAGPRAAQGNDPTMSVTSPPARMDRERA